MPPPFVILLVTAHVGDREGEASVESVSVLPLEESSNNSVNSSSRMFRSPLPFGRDSNTPDSLHRATLEPPQALRRKCPDLSACVILVLQRKKRPGLNPEEKRLLRRRRCCSGAITAAATNATGVYMWCVCPLLARCCLGACTVRVREGQNQNSLHSAACVDQILPCSQPWGVLPHTTACPDVQHQDPVHRSL